MAGKNVEEHTKEDEQNLKGRNEYGICETQ